MARESAVAPKGGQLRLRQAGPELLQPGRWAMGQHVGDPEDCGRDVLGAEEVQAAGRARVALDAMDPAFRILAQVEGDESSPAQRGNQARDPGFGLGVRHTLEGTSDGAGELHAAIDHGADHAPGARQRAGAVFGPGQEALDDGGRLRIRRGQWRAFGQHAHATTRGGMDGLHDHAAGARQLGRRCAAERMGLRHGEAFRLRDLDESPLVMQRQHRPGRHGEDRHAG